MEKKNKVIVISIIAIVLILVIVGGIIWYILANQEEDNSIKINKLYSKLTESNMYQITVQLDDNNKEITYVKDGKAYSESYVNGECSKYIVKDSNTYLLIDDREVYYTYQNNQMRLNKYTDLLKATQGEEINFGEEKINNKNYKYEEVQGFMGFAINLGEIPEGESVRTRFYFDGDKLKFVKTIAGNKEELIKVDILYKVDNDNLFEIPANYKEG